MRWRVLVFVGTLFVLAALDLRAPWGMAIGCAVYLLVVWPALR